MENNQKEECIPLGRKETMNRCKDLQGKEFKDCVEKSLCKIPSSLEDE